jgi:hypothetical protein
MPAYVKHENTIFVLVESHAAVWARCNSQWAAVDHADDDDVAAMVTAASELERAKPATRDEFISKWRTLAAFWREFEFDIEADDIAVMLSELAEVTDAPAVVFVGEFMACYVALHVMAALVDAVVRR